MGTHGDTAHFQGGGCILNAVCSNRRQDWFIETTRKTPKGDLSWHDLPGPKFLGLKRLLACM